MRAPSPPAISKKRKASSQDANPPSTRNFDSPSPPSLTRSSPGRSSLRQHLLAAHAPPQHNASSRPTSPPIGVAKLPSAPPSPKNVSLHSSPPPDQLFPSSAASSPQLFARRALDDSPDNLDYVELGEIELPEGWFSGDMDEWDGESDDRDEAGPIKDGVHDVASGKQEKSMGNDNAATTGASVSPSLRFCTCILPYHTSADPSDDKTKPIISPSPSSIPP
jgi:hypothetical protein